MKTEKEREVPEQQLKKRARQIIDAVFASPCVVETRCFSQPEAVEQLEDQIVALLLPPPQILDKRVAETEAPSLEDLAIEAATFLDKLGDRQAGYIAYALRETVRADAESLLQQPATSERCRECGHDCGGDEQGCEVVVNENPLTFCGHRCVFPATEAADEHKETERIVEYFEREHQKVDQQVSHLKEGDRVRVSGFLLELLQDVDAFLIEE
jgi:hypothetical protein